MKKHGFTLAEVLITLGIIGVVSALVIPTFTAQTQNAKIGPRVGKAISSFEQATKALIDEAGSDSLSGIDGLTNTAGTQAEIGTPDGTAFLGRFADHLKGSGWQITNGITLNPQPSIGGTTFSGASGGFTTSDGISYYFNTAGLGTVGTGNNPPHQRQYISVLVVDLNGQAEPNKDARDRFYFQVMDDGSLRPYGGTWQTSNSWRNKCKANNKPTDATRCAGHIVENGMKVYYK